MFKFATAALAATALTGAASAVTLYDADFATSVSIDHTSNGNALEPSPQAGGNFSIATPAPPASDTTRNFFETTGTSLISSDFGGDHFMDSVTIDVSAWNEVSVDVLGDFVGSDSFNNSPTEFIEYVYTLDGGADQQFFFFTDDPNGPDLNASTLVDVTGISDLTVGINANANGAGDGFEITSYTVEGTVLVPEPASLALLAAGLGVAGLRRRSA